MNVIKFILNLILLSFSYFNLWKTNKQNIKKGNYFILKDRNLLIDDRSIKLTNINISKLSKSLNFVRSTSFRLSFKAIFKLKNIFIINSLHDVILFKNKFLNKNSKKTKKEYYNNIATILKSTSLKEFKMIDDYRLIELFLPACKKNKIKTLGFMHGRISQALKFQKNLKEYKFDKYYVWNEYFKYKILRINKNYKKNEIIVKNPLKKYKIKSLVGKMGLMIVEEDKININTYKNLINILKDQNKFNLYFKFRPNNEINSELKKFCKNKNIKIFHRENIYKLFSKKKIRILVAFNSSLLIECSFYRIIPLMILSRHHSLKEYIDDEVVLYSKIKNIIKFIHNYQKSKKRFDFNIFPKKRVNDKKLNLLFYELNLMLQANINISDAIDILAIRTRSNKL